MNETALQDRIREALRGVLDPELHVDLVTAGMVKEVTVKGAAALVEIELTTPACPLKDRIESDVRAALAKVAGLSSLDLRFSARVRPAAGPQPLPGVRNVVAVASGKGGVGKSTVAVNLALALAREGAAVGLMDADVYGPSVPHLVGLPVRPPEGSEGRIVPFRVAAGTGSVAVMSIAFFLEEDQPVVWRGPMLHKLVQQFLNDVTWGELDYLLIDLPPGTGDIQLSLSQSVPLSGAVIVTTPQDVALLDVRRAVAMFAKVRVPVLGVVENMASFTCPGCGAEHALFGHGGGRALAADLGVALLGSIPLDIRVREGGDVGRPAVLDDPPGAAGQALVEAARRLAGVLSVRAASRPGGFVRELPVVGG